MLLFLSVQIGNSGTYTHKVMGNKKSRGSFTFAFQFLKQCRTPTNIFYHTKLLYTMLRESNVTPDLEFCTFRK